MGAVHFDSYSEARGRLKDLLDAAEHGRVATVRRHATRAAIVDVERLRGYLADVAPWKVQVVAEADGFSLFVPGVPVAADAGSFDEAVTEMVDALREYAQDWQERLSKSPNHQNNWGLVQLVGLSDDDQLRSWIVGERG